MTYPKARDIWTRINLRNPREGGRPSNVAPRERRVDKWTSHIIEEVALGDDP
ncbi:MAG: hypothetical protein ACT4O2_05660 [Beijerinckiaceae bacterium]